MDEQTTEAYIDTLLEEDVLVHDEVSDELATGEDFQGHLEVYLDTYMESDDEEFHETLAEVFDLPSAEAAAERADELEVTREELSVFLTLRARLEDASVEDLGQMAAIVTEVDPQSPIPEQVHPVDDDSYGDFLAEHDRAAVTVWKRGCAPCDGMKEDLDEILERLPDDLAVAGLDGEACPDFCASQEVNTAPAVVFFEDGERLDVVSGRTSPEPLADRAVELYGSA